MGDSGSFKITSNVGKDDIERTSFFGEIDVPGLLITEIVLLLVEKIKELYFVIRIIKMLITSILESPKKTFLSRREDKFVGYVINGFKEPSIMDTSGSKDDVNMRVPIKFSSEGMDNRKDSRGRFMLSTKEIKKRVRSDLRKDFESRTMSFEERAKLFRDSESKVIILESGRPSRKKFVHPEIRKRFSAGVTEPRFTSKRDMFFFSTIRTGKGGKSELRGSTTKDFVDGLKGKISDKMSKFFTE